jgi:hypothetical protein
MAEGTGTVWLDNVQVEPLPYATPYTSGARPPHDQALHALGF